MTICRVGMFPYFFFFFRRAKKKKKKSIKREGGTLKSNERKNNKSRLFLGWDKIRRRLGKNNCFIYFFFWEREAYQENVTQDRRRGRGKKRSGDISKHQNFLCFFFRSCQKGATESGRGKREEADMGLCSLRDIYIYFYFLIKSPVPEGEAAPLIGA